MAEKQPEKKPFYNIKTDKPYNYKKNSEGMKSLAEANMRAAGAKPKPKTKADIKAAVVKPKAKAAVKSAPGAMRSYRASKGDSLYSIAEKTLPKGKNLSSWFGAIKKMNAGKKLYSNTGVSLPPGSGQYKQGMPSPKNTRKPGLNGPR
jgi:hypothetical protein